MNRIFLSVITFSVLLLSGCGSDPVPQEIRTASEIISGYIKQYKQLPGAKAIAYTKDENGQYVFGNAYDYHSQKSANKRALTQCETKRKELGVTRSCQMLAEGDKFLRNYE